MTGILVLLGTRGKDLGIVGTLTAWQKILLLTKTAVFWHFPEVFFLRLYCVARASRLNLKSLRFFSARLPRASLDTQILGRRAVRGKKVFASWVGP